MNKNCNNNNMKTGQELPGLLQQRNLHVRKAGHNAPFAADAVSILQSAGLDGPAAPDKAGRSGRLLLHGPQFGGVSVVA